MKNVEMITKKPEVGNEMQGYPDAPNALMLTPNQKDKKGFNCFKITFIILLTLIILLGSAMLIIYFLSNNKNQDTNNTSGEKENEKQIDDPYPNIKNRTLDSKKGIYLSEDSYQNLEEALKNSTIIVIFKGLTSDIQFDDKKYEDILEKAVAFEYTPNINGIQINGVTIYSRFIVDQNIVTYVSPSNNIINIPMNEVTSLKYKGLECNKDILIIMNNIEPQKNNIIFKNCTVHVSYDEYFKLTINYYINDIKIASKILFEVTSQKSNNDSIIYYSLGNQIEDKYTPIITAFHKILDRKYKDTANLPIQDTVTTNI